MASTGKSVLSDRANSPMDIRGETPNGSGGKPVPNITGNTADVAGEYACKDFEDIERCFTRLHLKLTGIRDDVNSLKEKVSNLDQFAEHTNDAIRIIHESTIPNIEDKIAAADNERIKLDMWGRK